GRLDEKSEGLLLLTTHGKASEYIRSSQIEKEYYALVDGILTAEAVSSLTHGVNISVDGQPYLAKAKDAYLFFERPNVPDRFVRDEKHGPTSLISYTLSQATFRHVIILSASFDLPASRMVRVMTRNSRLIPKQP